MKIGLIGAPGAGKTRLAWDLQEQFGGVAEVGIVDDSAIDVEIRYHLPIGRFGDWTSNLAIALHRHGCESRLQGVGYDSHITCGTLIETAVYEAVNAYEQQTQDALIRCQNLMMTVSMLILDTWRYDHAFYLPLDEPINAYCASLDKEIPYTIKTIGAPVATIEGNDKLDQIVTEIEKASAEVPA